MKKKNAQILKILSIVLLSLCVIFALSACNKTEKSNNPSASPTTPKLISAENTGGGISITWEGIDGINNYRVYRKTEDSDWKSLGNIARTDYIDTSGENGTEYTYTVRGLSDDGETLITDYDHTGISATFNAAIPILMRAAAIGRGIEVAWEPVDGVNNYRVYRKTEDSKWKKLDDIVATSYVDISGVNGTQYIYTVRGLSDDGEQCVTNYDKEGIAAIYEGTVPNLVSATSTENGIEITWEMMEDIGNYRIYRKTEEDKWNKLQDVSGTSYMDTSAEAGVTYIYTVRGLSDDNQVLLTGYNRDGISAVRQ